ncbi:hypothetical protein [Thermogemmatispora sp.]|uniref:hypothetical protein n=1 Tax=Thermogemmatispora sp. TaxID=1968838 RepID=UPI001DE31CAA|nr:hypothetical protein [Thermogemmatispora sp.]MBX5450073.1 hypothetical protein [Thermogemmatispora sp.]
MRRSKVYGIRCRSWWLVIAPALVALLVALSACGTNATTSGGSNQSAPSPTKSAATPTVTTVKGYGTSHGCPSDAVVTEALPPQAVIVKNTQDGQTIKVSRGTLVVFELPFGQRWETPAGSQGVLELQQPAGYASQQAHACIWRYVAQGSGQSEVVFMARPLCQPHLPCPQYIMRFSFTIAVQ